MQILRWGGLVLGVVWASLVCGAEPPAGEAKRASPVVQLAPLIDDNTLVVFRMDVKRIAGEEAFDVLARLFPPKEGFVDKEATRKQMLERWKALADRGGETLYLIMRVATGADNGLIGAVPVKPGVDPQPLLEWLQYLDGEERHRSEGLVWTTGAKTAADIKSRPPGTRADLSEAFQSVDDAPLLWAMALTDDPRRLLASFIPDLPTELGGDALRQVAGDTKWIVVSGQLGEEARLKIDVRLANDERAKQLEDLLVRLRAALPRLPAVQQAVPNADAFFARQTPRRADRHVSLEFSRDDTKLLIHRVFAEQLRIWSERNAQKQK